MARIPDEFIGCVFFLYPTRSDAETGNERGGTGFFVGNPWHSNPNRFHLYAVTNKHNITACRDHVVIRATTVHGKLDFTESDPIEWHPSPAHDLSVLRIVPDKAALFRSVSGQRFVEPDEFKEDKAKPTSLGPGDKVFMIGRFISHDGKTTNHPSARFGNLSMLPAPIRHPGGYEQESFAVEMRSLSGYSGSPVFIYWEFGGGHLEGIRRTMVHSYLGFLGVDWGHIPLRLPVLDLLGKPLADGQHVKSHTSMSGVVPAWHLMELLDTKILREQRMQDEADETKKEKDNPTAELDFAHGKPASSDDDANPNHLPDFNRLVDVAARKKPKEG
jgi:hypothetical protein